MFEDKKEIKLNPNENSILGVESTKYKNLQLQMIYGVTSSSSSSSTGTT